MPAFTLEPVINALKPQAVLLLGGAGLMLGYQLVQARLPGFAQAPLAGAGLAGLVLVVLALYGRQARVQHGRQAQALRRLAAWLGVRPRQVMCLGLAGLYALLAGGLGAGDWARNVNPWVSNLAWALAIVLAVLGGWRTDPAAPRPAWRTVALVAVLVAAAFAVRAFDVAHIPVTLTGDEGSAGISAVRLAEGEANNLFGIGWHGFPAFFYFIQSLPITFLGRTVTAVRLPSAMAGALTVGALYLLGRSLFGHRTGVVAAVFLVGLHYHQHFSRIGLNNVWDGLAYVVTLGALWHGWHSGRRASFLLAGLGLALGQYFYPSTRVLFALVPAWLLVAGWLDRPRLRQRLPDLALMALVAGVTLLPLAWFFARHWDEYMGPMRAVSLTGPRLEQSARDAGLPVWSYLLRQIGMGLQAFTSRPLTSWYRPGVPILRFVPSILFAAGLGALAVRSRDPRTWLVGLWLLAFGLLGGLTESTPAGQRFMGAAPACALLVGLGLVDGAGRLAKLWPRLGRVMAVAVVLTTLGITVDDLRFYYREYTPNSRHQGRYDFEGLGAAVAGRLARYLGPQSGDWQVIFFGSPYMGFYSIPSLQFLAPHITGLEMVQPWGSPENPAPTSEKLIFVGLANHVADLRAAQASYPGGLWVSFADHTGDPLFHVYQYPYPKNAGALQRLAAQQPVSLVEQMPAALGWGLLGLLTLAAAAWSLVYVWRLKEPFPPELPWDEPAAVAPPAAGTAQGSAVAQSGAVRPERRPATRPGTEASRPAVAPASRPAGVMAASRKFEPLESGAAQPVSLLQLWAKLAPGARVRITVEDVTEGVAGEAPLLQQEVGVEAGLVPPGSTLPVVVVLQPGLPATITPSVPEPGATIAAPPGARQVAEPGWLGRLWRAVSTAAAPVASALSWDRWPRMAQVALDLRGERLAVVLFGLALAVYAVTRLTALDEFPIYFFSDEAIQTLNAADFIRDGFRDYRGRYFPTYFQNASYFNLSTSVYAQVLPYLLFGKSVVVTRAVSALLSLLGVAAVGLMLKNIFRARWWWLGVALLSVTPAWFLHSRTAFETVLMVSFYAWFLYFYLLYRYQDPRCLYPALVCGALAYYSYNGGQLVVVLTGFLLLLSDLPYHWRQRRTGWRGLLLLAVLVLPYLRFHLEQPGEAWRHLRILDSYWVDRDLTLGQKLAQFWREYRFGLSPSFWLLADNRRDLVRHVMKGYGHLLPALAPFLLLGLAVSLRQVRQPAYRALLLALLVAPVGGALTSVGITRVLVLVVPATLLTALGLEAVRARFSSLGKPAVAAGLLALLAGFNVLMLRDALANGPTWFHDYGIGGLQWGARQVYADIEAYLARAPSTQVRLTSTWANGADYLLRFFADGDSRIKLESIHGYTLQRQPLTDDYLFVMLASEYAAIKYDPKFTDVRVEQVLPYPDGSHGFLFVRLRYSQLADALFTAEQEARRVPLTETLTLDGEAVTVTYSRMDTGRIHDVFDGDTFTLGRTQESNPAIVELAFSTPRVLQGVTVTTGSMDVHLVARLYAATGGEAVVYERVFAGLPPDPTVHLEFDGQPLAVSKLRLEIGNPNNAETGHIHLREITLER